MFSAYILLLIVCVCNFSFAFYKDTEVCSFVFFFKTKKIVWFEKKCSLKRMSSF